jgi:hypothetical protein
MCKEMIPVQRFAKWKISQQIAWQRELRNVHDAGQSKESAAAHGI